MLSFNKLWLEGNGDKTFMGEGCRGCWLKTYFWMALVDGSSLNCTVQLDVIVDHMVFCYLTSRNEVQTIL